MAKLEEQTTPEELLKEIKDGALKQDLIKKYKVSEQDLAMMLLPLYREGKLTKEEFNDFFRGIAVTGGDIASRDSSHDDTPSEILRSLAKTLRFGKTENKLGPANEKNAEIEIASPTIVGKAETEQASVSPPESGKLEEHADAQQGDTDTPVKGFTPNTETSVESTAEASGLKLVELSPEAVNKKESLSHESLRIDSAKFASLLNTIFSRLNSIEDRVALLEQTLKDKKT
jgi:hypothetical protein